MTRAMIRAVAQAAAALTAIACVGVGASTAALAPSPPRPLSDAKGVDVLAAGITEAARHRTRADRLAAHELIVQADADYKAGRYDAAHAAYDNANANSPNAWSYIMTGDAHWRAALAFAQQPTVDGEASVCRLQRLHFVDDLRLDLNQQYLVGLRLAQGARLPPLPGSTMRTRARESAACLARLADDYEPRPPQTCIDITRLARCLGAPLMK